MENKDRSSPHLDALLLVFRDLIVQLLRVELPILPASIEIRPNILPLLIETTRTDKFIENHRARIFPPRTSHTTVDDIFQGSLPFPTRVIRFDRFVILEVSRSQSNPIPRFEQIEKIRILEMNGSIDSNALRRSRSNLMMANVDIDLFTIDAKGKHRPSIVLLARGGCDLQFRGDLRWRENCHERDWKMPSSRGSLP